MDSSLFKLTSLNLNGIRSATTKGVEAWIEATAPDCICVQEIKAQAPDMAGRFEQLAGLDGYFHFAEKKGYSGVGVYTRHEPADVIVGLARRVRRRRPLRGGAFRHRRPQAVHHQRLLSQRQLGRDRQQAKFRFWPKCTST
jgi:exonuclease III